MIRPNPNYAELKDSFLFTWIGEKTKEYKTRHPGQRILPLGVGDVSQPLCPAIIAALHAGVDEQARFETFQGYQPECGAPFFREAVARHYTSRGVPMLPREVFVSSGAADELGDILDLFVPDSPALVIEPAYPAYLENSVIGGWEVMHLAASRENGFLPDPPAGERPGLIYLCSPNNPTGAAFGGKQLKTWVDYANDCGAVILFDAAYEAFIEDKELPHSIFEIPGARTCAIEICSLSKTAGFTGTRLGYTAIPLELTRGGMNFNAMWTRNRNTKTNGISYILQRGGVAAFTPEGRRQTKQQLARYKQNAKLLTDAMDRCGFWYTGGKNAPYIWLHCPNGMGGWEFFDYLLDQIQVIGTPGEGFGACGEGFFRFSTFGTPEDTEEAARRLVTLFRG